MADQVQWQTADPLAGSPDGLVLDHAVWTSLTGPHERFAEVKGRTARYPGWRWGRR